MYGHRILVVQYHYHYHNHKAEQPPHRELNQVSEQQIYEFLDLNQSGTIERLELDHLFASNVGEQISEGCLVHLMEEIDANRDGSMQVSELAAYINTMAPATKKKRNRFVLAKMVASFGFWGGILFLVASIMTLCGKAMFLFDDDDAAAADSLKSLWIVQGLIFLVGCTGFIVLRYELEARRNTFADTLLLLRGAAHSIDGPRHGSQPLIVAVPRGGLMPQVEHVDMFERARVAWAMDEKSHAV